MADHFLGALKELERRTHDNVLVFSDVLSERLDDLATSMVGSRLSDNDYMKVMELYYQKYQKAQKKKAMMYCLLRIQQMAEYKLNPRLRSEVSTIEFSDAFDEFTIEFLKKRKPHYQRLKVELKKRSLLIGFLCATIFLMMSVLVFRMPFLTGWILSILLYVGMYFLMMKVGYPYFFETRLNDLQDELEPLCLALDMSVFSNNQ